MTAVSDAIGDTGEATSRIAPLLLGAMVGALVAGRLETGVLMLAIAAAAAVVAGAGWPGRRFWTVLAGGTGVAVVLNAYLVEGTPLPLPALFGRAATGEGAVLGVLLALRVWGAAVAVHGLKAAWPGERAADEIAARLAPLERVGVPVARSRVILGLALRFAPLLAEELSRVRALQRLRAGAPAGGARARLVRLQAVLVPALTGALERAERVALALEARHYRIRPVSVPGAHRGWQAAGLACAAVALLWRG